MARVEQVTVPDIGDFDAVDVVEVLVSAGDQVSVDDSLISLESDKATMDVPSPLAGRVVEVAVKVGDAVAHGDLILTLEPAEVKQEPEAAPDGSVSEGAPAPTDAAPAAPDSMLERPAPPPPSPVPPPLDAGASKAYASPSVRRIARQLGVDLSRVRGTGRKGRILKEDVQAFVKEAMTGTGAGTAGLPEMPIIDFSKFGEIDRQPLTRIQRISGPNLHRSWLHVPHVTQNDHADITEMEAFRKANKGRAEAEGVRLTPLAFLMKASVAALRRFPAVNSSLDPDGEHLVYKKYYHLGIAVDTPGGLMVPVVRDVDQKGIFELARELGEVSAATREGKLKPDQLRGASFTISSLGGIGGDHFSPIVNAPEVAILGVGRSRIEATWTGESFEPRLMLPFSLSYDHRVVDGALAVRFTTYLSQVLGDLRRLLL